MGRNNEGGKKKKKQSTSCVNNDAKGQGQMRELIKEGRALKDKLEKYIQI